MTEFEMVVWASAYAAAWDSYEHPDPRQVAGHAFESATYAVEELRLFKIEPVFGEGSEVSEIESAILAALKKGEHEDD